MLDGAGRLLAIIIYRLDLLDAATAYIVTRPGAMTSLIPLSTEGGANIVKLQSEHPLLFTPG